MSKSEVEIQTWFVNLIHNQKYFTARWAKKYSEVTGVEVDMLVKCTVLLVFSLLVITREPHYVANGLLVVVPTLVTFLEPADRPAPGVLFIYWAFFGLSVMFDRLLELFPLYYVAKLLVFVALFLPPSNPTIQKIHDKILEGANFEK